MCDAYSGNSLSCELNLEHVQTYLSNFLNSHNFIAYVLNSYGISPSFVAGFPNSFQVVLKLYFDTCTWDLFWQKI